MKITVHQTHHTIADFNATHDYLKKYFVEGSPEEGIHLFPELFLCGYPLQDLCLHQTFIQNYQKQLKQVNELAKSFVPGNYLLVLGGLDYKLNEKNIPLNIFNGAFTLAPGKSLNCVYHKQLLPNYDIFDEKKYFTKGQTSFVLEWEKKKYGLLICEDMWVSNMYQLDPCQNLMDQVQSQNIKLDAILNLSASPFNIGKYNKRVLRAKEIANQFECPFVYVNRVGGEDEILFDGRSFSCNGKDLLSEGKFFSEDILSIDLENIPPDFTQDQKAQMANSWEDLFSPKLNYKMHEQDKLPTLKPLTNLYAMEALEALKFGFQEYASKANANRFTIALSGGIDSSLVLAIVRLALKPDQILEAIYMPSIYSAPLSHELSSALCHNLGVPMKTLPIKFLHSAAKNLFGQSFQESFEGIADENIQSRLRGMLLYARSNQVGSLVINTSNKSEIAVGYSTQYGDSVGAISLLGDLYKTEVYELANYINELYPKLIPDGIIQRAPSAELRPDQFDGQSLPPYDRLDAMLEGILSFKFTSEDLLQQGFAQEEIDKVIQLYTRNEYKRYQFCPIIKLSSKSFGFGYRIPISKHAKVFFNK